MRTFTSWIGWLMAVACCLAVNVTAQQRPLPVPALARNVCKARQDSPFAPNPILTAMARRLRSAFQRDRLPIRVRLDDDGLVAEYHTHHAKVYLRGMDGREAARLTDLVVPADDGVLLQLQLEPGDYIDQAVRPQTRHENYRIGNDKLQKWTTYLGQDRLKKANKSLLINFEYGAHVSSRWVNAIKTAVRNGASATP